jgi:uncharacterized protein YggU (UPF0235/DUF167 family)
MSVQAIKENPLAAAPRLACKNSVGFVSVILQNPKHMPSVRLQVYVHPRIFRTELAGMHDGVMKIRIAAAAMENAADLALIGFVAQRLGIAKRHVRVVSGSDFRVCGWAI